MPRLVARLEAIDPGFTRASRGVRTTCATVLSGFTLAVLTSVFDASEALRISLIGAGVCFFAALLVVDLRRGDRATTFGWASGASSVAIVMVVELSRTAAWAAAAFLVVQMFMSHALRPWSPRAGILAMIGALVTFLAGAMHVTSDQIGWFVGGSGRRATAGAGLDRAHSAVDVMIAAAVIKTHLFPRQGSPLTEQGVRIDAVHEAFLRLTSSLSDSSRRLHGWTDERLAMTVRLLRDDVAAAKSAALGGSTLANAAATSDADEPGPRLLIDNLRTRLGELAQHR